MKKNKGLIQFKISVFERIWKTLIFCLLIVVEILIVATNWKEEYFGVRAWIIEIPLCAVLTVENAVKIWGVPSQWRKIPCYVIDTLLLIVITVFSNGSLISTLYIVILSEFYLTEKNLVSNIAMGVSSIALFLIAFAVSYLALGQEIQIFSFVSGLFNDIILIAFHFLILNFTTQVFRKNRDLTKAIDKLNVSNRKLNEAYRELQEVTALEERQRIAKDIHDTAGHSITTVIMQTEAAKLVMEKDPEEAKRRICAANIQAKNALEELRESVHLLSGKTEDFTLKEMLVKIIHDTVDGLEIKIRYDIDEIVVCDAKRRFLCNSLKEGISNGLRHGGATAFWFEIKNADGEIRFLLSDNGRGMNIGEMKEGFGITGMYRRAEALGGNAWIETEKDEGFELHITLPQDGEKETT